MIALACRSIGLAVVAIAALVSCSNPTAERDDSALTRMSVTSASFGDGVIPQRYACFESGAGPALAWSAGPDSTRTYAVVARDLDSTLSSLLGPFVHWVVYDIPPTQHALPDAIPPQPQLADGVRQGINGFDKFGFAGPCPPGEGWHRYEFKVYALDSAPSLTGDATAKALLAAMKGHIVAVGSVIGRYKR